MVRLSGCLFHFSPELWVLDLLKWQVFYVFLFSKLVAVYSLSPAAFERRPPQFNNPQPSFIAYSKGIVLDLKQSKTIETMPRMSCVVLNRNLEQTLQTRKTGCSGRV